MVFFLLGWKFLIEFLFIIIMKISLNNKNYDENVNYDDFFLSLSVSEIRFFEGMVDR